MDKVLENQSTATDKVLEDQSTATDKVLDDKSTAMETIFSSLFHLGGVIRGFPPVISPSMQDFEFMQYAQQPLQPAADIFQIMMDVKLFQHNEIEIHVIGKTVLEIKAGHDRRQNSDGLWMARSFVFTYDLPPDAIGKEIRATWSVDNYLSIKATSTVSEENEPRVRIVPEHVQTTMKPAMNVNTLRDMIEDIRDRAMQVLRYLRFHTQNVPSIVFKEQRDMERPPSTILLKSSPSNATDTSLSPDEMRTSSSEPSK